MIPRHIDSPLTDVRHELDCHITTGLGALGERAVFNVIVEPTQADPVHIFTIGIRGSARIETQVRESDIP